MTFVQATFVLGTFVHVSNISAVTGRILTKLLRDIISLDQILNKGSREHIQQITTVTTTFVQATFVLGTFVHISNISAVTGPIWIKL